MCRDMHCFGRSMISHAIGLYFALFVFVHIHKRWIYMFHDGCFVYFGLYEHVWVPKLSKCDTKLFPVV